MHELLTTHDEVFMSFVEAMLKAEGIPCERIPQSDVYRLGASILCVDDEDAARAKEILTLAEAKREAPDGG